MLILKYLFVLICLTASNGIEIRNTSYDGLQNENVEETTYSKKQPSTIHLTQHMDIHLDRKKDKFHPNLKDAIITSHVEDNEEAIQSRTVIDDNISTLRELMDELDEIKKIRNSELKYYKKMLETQREMKSLYEKVVQKSEAYLYLTKVGVSNPIISDSSIKIESEDERKKHNNIPENCLGVLKEGNNISGVYKIQPNRTQKPFMVLCDMNIRGGGWTHIHKRFDGSVDFFLGWREYKMGFGDLLGEFWIGLEHIRWLTGSTPSELLVELVDKDNVTKYAYYQAFSIGPEPDGYPLKILSGYSGDAGDSLSSHRRMKFSTKDHDQDVDVRNCAVKFSGAWWYHQCYDSNLNGKYINVQPNSNHYGEGMRWNSFFDDKFFPRSKARMLVRPASGIHSN